MIELSIFISFYLISKEASKYTLLSNYEVFNKLHSDLQQFKLFICKPCNMFWIAFLLGFAISFATPYNYTLFALATYLFAKIDDIWTYINNN